MAHHSATKKSIRQTKRRTISNGAQVSRIRTYIKKVELAIQGENKEEAQAALRDAQPIMMRGARMGLLPSNRVARKISRLSARIKSLSA